MSSYIPIASQTLTSAASSVTFSSIPTTLGGKTLRDLVLVVADTGNSYPSLRFNNDSATNYNFVQMSGDGSSTSSSSITNRNELNIYNNSGGFNSVRIVQIFDYSVTDKHTSVLVRANRAAAAVEAFAGRWANTAAITSVNIADRIGGSFAAGATFSIYGVAA